MSFPPERRSSKFVENLSYLLVGIAGFGAAWVLMEPILTIPLAGGAVLKLGSTFGPDLKGMIIGQIIIAGFASAVGYHLGASATGQRQADSVSKIAEVSSGAAQPSVSGQQVNVTGQTVKVEETK